MWCPRCGSEFREGIPRCAGCDVDLVATPPEAEYSLETGPLTGRPIGDEIETTGPALAGVFVTMEEAQAALRALSDAGIKAEIAQRDEMFPMTISKHESAYGITVAPPDIPRAREVLKATGLLPTAVARFKREDEARSALAFLEGRNIKARISALVMEEIPAEFREEMDPYVLEVPAEQEGPAVEALEEMGLKACDACGAQLQSGDPDCRACGEPVAG